MLLFVSHFALVSAKTAWQIYEINSKSKISDLKLWRSPLLFVARIDQFDKRGGEGVGNAEKSLDREIGAALFDADKIVVFDAEHVRQLLNRDSAPTTQCPDFRADGLYLFVMPHFLSKMIVCKEKFLSLHHDNHI